MKAKDVPVNISQKDLLVLFPFLKIPEDLKDFFSRVCVMQKEEADVSRMSLFSACASSA